MGVNQRVHQGAAQSQKFMTTNMATVEEVLIMYFLHKSEKYGGSMAVIVSKAIKFIGIGGQRILSTAADERN